MKKYLMLCMMALAAISGRAQFTKADLQATGLTCAMCSNAINKALQEVSFVESVRSDIKNSAFAIKFKSNAVVNIDAIKLAVEDAGFSVGSLKVTGSFEGIKIEKDKHIRIGNDHFHFLNTDDQVLKGEKTIIIVDKDFVTEKQFRKYSTASKMECVKTGKAASCCAKDGVQSGERVYHVTI